MQNESKVEVKFKLDKHRFIRLEVEKEKRLGSGRGKVGNWRESGQGGGVLTFLLR